MLKIPEELAKRIVWHKPDKKELALPVSIKEIKPQTDACPDCGKQVQNRIVFVRKLTSPCDHWRSQCQICKNYKNPETGLFDLKSDKVNSFFRTFFNKENK